MLLSGILGMSLPRYPHIADLAAQHPIHAAGTIGCVARVEAVNPRIRAEIVPGTTHSLSLEEPGLVTARILETAGTPR